MSRLIDADKVAEAIAWLDEYDFVIWHEVQKCIDKAPTVDAEPVVRCKDCTRYAPFKDIDGVCLAHNTGVLIVMSQNGYCNLGERKEDERGGR